MLSQNYDILCKFAQRLSGDANQASRESRTLLRIMASVSSTQPAWGHASWSRRRGSNPHGTKYHWILSPARLPVPPLRGNDSNYHARRLHSRRHVVSQWPIFSCEFIRQNSITRLDFATRPRSQGYRSELRRRTHEAGVQSARVRQSFPQPHC